MTDYQELENQLRQVLEEPQCREDMGDYRLVGRLIRDVMLARRVEDEIRLELTKQREAYEELMITIRRLELRRLVRQE